MQADVAIAPSDHSRIYATVASPRGVGIFRSGDAGDSWTRITTDARPAARTGGGDLNQLAEVSHLYGASIPNCTVVPELTIHVVAAIRAFGHEIINLPNTLRLE